MERRIVVLGTVLASVALLAVLAAGTAFAQTPGGAYGPGWGCGPGGVMGGPWGGTQQPSGNRISMDQAQQAAGQAVSAYGNQKLALSEIMEFQYNFYVEVKEKDTGVHAFELLVNPYTGGVFPEMGPNMMWNTKYGMMGGMMGGGMMGGWWGGTGGPPTADMPVKADQAIKNADDFLAQAFPGAQAASDPSTFYGYYTMDFSKDGKTLGMLSVNGYSGQVWLHTWHGDFVGER